MSSKHGSPTYKGTNKNDDYNQRNKDSSNDDEYEGHRSNKYGKSRKGQDRSVDSND